MSGYTPVFGSVFQGSLAGKFPDLPLWLVLLAMADKNGHIDAHPSYIAMVSGISADLVGPCIERFCQPDPSSRTPDDDGRRLIPLEGRGFGWRVVNHGKYREKARKMAYDMARVEDGRNAERMTERRKPTATRDDPTRPDATRDDPTRPDATRDDPPSDANANADTYTPSLRSGVQGGEPPTTPKPVGSKAKSPRTRKPEKFTVPDDFTLSPELRAYAEGRLPGVDADGLFTQFREQSIAKAWTYANWPMAFQTYVRNCQSNSGHFAAGCYPKSSAPRTHEKQVRRDLYGREICA